MNYLCLFSACIRDLYWKQPSSSDLDALLAEVRALRSQLLQGIQVNNSLRQQLEQQQEGRASLATQGSTSHVFAASKPPGDWQLFQGEEEEGCQRPCWMGAEAAGLVGPSLVTMIHF